MPRSHSKQVTLEQLSKDRDRVLADANVSRETLERLDRFVALVLQWQNTVNLIAPSTISEIWTRHVADSLQLLEVAPDAKLWVDLGSGGGFPGIVIACALADRPGAVVHLVESNQKKAAFLREALRITGAAGVVHPIRIEAFVNRFTETPDVVTARALAPLPELLDMAFRLLKKGAKGVFPKGQDVEAELTEAAKYWKIAVRLLPSKTSPKGCILVLDHVEQRPSGRDQDQLR